ncbi:MAG: conserved rane protein of unknown function [Frankiales bacterium]|nr:conserved rane protein of unknown function [Frankiales bacterium]
MDHSQHAAATGGKALTRLAVSATLHCLTGCALGEVLGMVLATALGWSNTPTVVLSVALAFFFGYSLTVKPVLASGLALSAAIPVALAADTVSIAVMEVVDNAFMLAVPDALDAGLSDPLFWGSLAASLLTAFVITVPVNRALIAQGKGHAVVHQYHQPAGADAHAGPSSGGAHHDADHWAGVDVHDDDRAACPSADLARQLDDQHPGTVLLLAQHAPGDVPLTSLELQVRGGGRGPHGAAHDQLPDRQQPGRRPTVASMGRSAATTRAARPLAVLAVLLGLLAMHGLVGAHHAAAATSTHQAPAAGAVHHHGPAGAPFATPAHATVVARAVAVLVDGPGASCDGDCAHLGELCLAVLTGAALALLLARRGPAPLLLAPTRRAPRGAGPPGQHARGPDPVRELCISRT